MEPRVSPEIWREVWLPSCTSIKSPNFPPHLNRRADTPFTTWEESGVPCLNTRRGMAPLLKLYRNPEIPVETGEEHRVSHLTLHEALFPCSDSWERNTKGPLATWKEAWLPWGNMRGPLRPPSQLERNPKFTAATQEKPRDSPLKARWAPIHLQWLKSNSVFPLATRKESWLLLCKLRGFPR